MITISIISIIILSILTIAIFSISKFKKTEKKYGESLKILIPLVGALLLIPLAFWLNNEIQNQINKKNLVNLLQTAQNDLIETREKVIVLYTFIESEENTENQYWHNFKTQSIPKPQILFNLIKNDLMLVELDNESIKSIRSLQENTNRIIANISTDSIKFEYLKGNIYVYGSLLWYTDEILKFTSQYLNDEIDEKQLDTLKQKIIRQDIALKKDTLIHRNPYSHPWMILGK